MSNLEADYFKILSWSLDVVELREQFPLLPLERTLEIAKSLGVQHPSFQGEPIVMTTDALISVRRPIGISQHPRAVKPSGELENKRVIEKLEIERLYWEPVEGPDWGIITELDIPKVLLTNVSWIYHRYHTQDVGLPDREINRVATVLTKWVLEKHAPLSELAADCDELLGLFPGSSLSVVRHPIARRKWIVDMNQLIEPSKRLVLLSSSV